ncbi:MAG: sulfatase-like hydrolase/transferase [Rikenellaceae bacterium]
MRAKQILSAIPLFAIASCQVDCEIEQRPNIILIYADDLGKGMLSSYGQQQLTTPNIDKIVNHGVKFNNAYSSAYSAPARFSLLTGYNDCRNDKYIISRGGPYNVLDTMLIAPREDSIYMRTPRFEANDLHLAQVFGAAGYKSCAIGKLEWGFLSTRRQMDERGWDEYYGFLDHNRCHGYYPAFIFHNGEIELIEGNTHANAFVVANDGTPDDDYDRRWDMSGRTKFSEDLFIEQAEEFIANNRNQPFFLYYASQLPHGPVCTPDIDPELAANSLLTQYEKEYGSMIKHLDSSVGRIFKALEKNGLEENTMVIFMADNGHSILYNSQGRCSNGKDALMDGRTVDHYEVNYTSQAGGDVFNGNGGTSGLKRSSLDGGVNVPFAVYWKGHLTSRNEDELIVSYDILPTFADMLGVELETQKCGVSFKDVLMNGAKLNSNRTIVIDSQNIGPMIARNDGWKLRYVYPFKCYQLFNLNDDPMEQCDLIDKYPEIANELAKKLNAECSVGYNGESFASGELILE